MKLARFGDDHATALVVDMADGRQLLDVNASLPAFSSVDPAGGALLAELLPHYDGRRGPWPWTLLIDRWDEAREPLDRLAQWGLSAGSGAVLLPLETVKLQAPMAAIDSRFFALGGNFRAHAAGAWVTTTKAVEGGIARPKPASTWNTPDENKRNGAPPWGFNVLAGTVIGPDDVAEPPPHVRCFDYEGEVAVVLRGRGVDATVWGITAWNDLSIRDPQFGFGPRVDEGPHRWSLQKNFDCGYSVGPWIAVDEGLDHDRARIRTWVNGELRQDGWTDDMVYTFQDVIDHVGTFLTLRSGDGVASGTPPGTAFEAGADGPYLRDGDVVEVEVEGVGVLRNPIRIPTKGE